MRRMETQTFPDKKIEDAARALGLDDGQRLFVRAMVRNAIAESPGESLDVSIHKSDGIVGVIFRRSPDA